MRRRNFLKNVAGAGAAGFGLSAANLAGLSAAPPPPGGPLKKGISIWCFPQGTALRDALKKAHDAGFDGLEVAFHEKGELGPNSTPDDMRRLADDARKIGIEIAGLASGEGWNYPLTDNDPKTREHGKMLFRKCLEMAEGLGTDSVLVVPGNLKARRGRPGEMACRYETAWERATEALRDLLPTAEKHKVSLSIENVWNNFLLSPLEMRSFVDQFKSPYVQAHMDIGNVIRYGYAEDWVLTLGPRIKRVHIKDFNVSRDTFVNLLEGDLNWPAAIKALKEVGFRGHLIAELGYNQFAPDNVLYNTSKALDYILAM